MLHLEKNPTLQFWFLVHYLRKISAMVPFFVRLGSTLSMTTGQVHLSAFSPPFPDSPSFLHGKRLIQLPRAVIFWMFDVGRLSFVLLVFSCLFWERFSSAFGTLLLREASAALWILHPSFFHAECQRSCAYLLSLSASSSPHRSRWCVVFGDSRPFVALLQ